MKRPSRPKRRMRRVGQSPYARHKKVPFTYSAEYNSWKAKMLGRTQRKEVKK